MELVAIIIKFISLKSVKKISKDIPIIYYNISFVVYICGKALPFMTIHIFCMFIYYQVDQI